jgi:hypothetical protein
MFKPHLHGTPRAGVGMRLLRTLIMGGVMLIPGLLLAMLVWYFADPVTEPVESIICNGIPLLSITLGLLFGWKTGEAYAVQIDSNVGKETKEDVKNETIVQNITYNIQDSAISGDLNPTLNLKDK